MIYLNKKNINKINKIKFLWGDYRTSQTNSIRSGKLCILRLYNYSHEKGKTNMAITTCTKEKDLDKTIELIENYALI